MEPTELTSENENRETASKLSLISFITALIAYFIIGLILVAIEYYYFIDNSGPIKVLDAILSLIFGPFCMVTGIIALKKIKTHKTSMLFASAGITYGFLMLLTPIYAILLAVIVKTVFG